MSGNAEKNYCSVGSPTHFFNLAFFKRTELVALSKVQTNHEKHQRKGKGNILPAFKKYTKPLSINLLQFPVKRFPVAWFPLTLYPIQ